MLSSQRLQPTLDIMMKRMLEKGADPSQRFSLIMSRRNSWSTPSSEPDEQGYLYTGLKMFYGVNGDTIPVDIRVLPGFTDLEVVLFYDGPVHRMEQAHILP